MKKLSFFLFLFFSFFSCSKDENETIPYVYVNFSIQPNSTLYQKLNTVGGWEYLTGGYNGIVVYRQSQDEFVAFDRACPYDYKNSCRIVVESSFTTTIDSCCGSRFLLNDGSPFKGPASVSLKKYKTYYDGSSLHISN
ncbi:MAG: hypothetical protein HXX18_03165 [Bacteroidetes bacterium]|nr:hypothetical protein [Bacteroidota bacterium]